MAQEDIRSSDRLLEHLNGSKYEIVPSQPKVNGWWVTDAAGAKIGHVDDLIFSPESMKVRYLLVNMADNDFGIKTKSVLVPLDAVDLKESEMLIVVPPVNEETLQSLPSYRKELLNSGAGEEADKAFAKMPDNGKHSEMLNDSPRHGAPANTLETFRNGQMEIKIYKEVPVKINRKDKFMKEKEPFEIYIEGEMLTIIPQDETYMVFKGMSKLGDIMPHQDDSGLVWVTGDLIPLDYLAEIGKQIEQSDAWNQIRTE